MRYEFSRKTLVILAITIIAGFIFYNIAPTEIEPGQYNLNLELHSEGIDATQVFNVSFVTETGGGDVTYLLIGISTNVTVTIPQYVEIAPDSPLRVTLEATGEDLSAHEIMAILSNGDGFNLTLRPNRQSGQTFIIEYQPLVNSQSAVMILTVVAILWFSEGISLVATSLLIPVLIVLTDIRTPQAALSPFFDPAVALIFGGFLIGRALTKYELDKRLALLILSRGDGSGSSLILTVMGITAFLSMWISNTATAAMMYPIALGILEAFRSGDGNNISSSFGTILLLTLAYAASIGGIGTPIGSPPNLIAIGMLERLVDYRVTFFQWMVIGFLILIPMFFVVSFLMKWKLRGEKSAQRSKPVLSIQKDESKSPLNRAQKNVLMAFSVTVFLWIFPGFVSLIWGRESPVFLWFHDHFPESVAAIIGASLLFFLPIKPSLGEFTLSLKDALKIDWGTLLLFGGGLSLGFQMFETGLADAIGKFFISMGGGSASLTLIILLSVTFSVFLTELTSNTASANMVIPIIIAISNAASINPVPPVLGSAIGCSFAFMLPVATPPNAIVFGTQRLRIAQMARVGLVLNFVGVVCITAAAFLLLGVSFGLDVAGLPSWATTP